MTKIVFQSLRRILGEKSCRRKSVCFAGVIIKVRIYPSIQTSSIQEKAMIVVRNVFRLKFGKSREAVAIMKENFAKEPKMFANARLMTDLVGQFYTVVLEITFDSMTEFQESSRSTMDNPEWRERYQKFSALVDSGYREIFTVV